MICVEYTYNRSIDFNKTSDPNSTIIVIILRNFDPNRSYILVDIVDIYL